MPVLIFIVFFSIGLMLRNGVLMDPDTGWHIASGDLIRELGRMPASDPWSFTAGDYPWVDMSWAYDVLLSFVHSAGGLPGVAVFTVALYALTTALIALSGLKSSGSVIASFVTCLMCGAVLLPGMLARPQTLTFLLAAAFYLILRFGGWRAHYAVPLLGIAWANIHGGFLAGPMIVGAFFLEALAARDWSRTVHFMIIGVLCTAGALVNPYGWHVFEAAHLAMTSEMRALIVEWSPTEIGFQNPAALVFLLAFLFTGALHERSIPLADKILACFWFLMGLMSGRMMHIAAILCAPYLAQAIALRLRQTNWGEALIARDKNYAADFARPAAYGAFVGVAVALATGSLTPPVQRALAGPAPFVSLPSSTAPEKAFAFLGANYPHLRLFNEYGMGGYLIYRFRGEPRIFFDGRVEPAYPRKVMRDGIVIGELGGRKTRDEESAAEWRALVGEYGIEGFLLSPSRVHLIDRLSGLSAWRKVYEDEHAALFVRADLVR